MTALGDLLEALRQGRRPPLSVDDVELLLGWLTGSAARDGAEDSGLPRPGHDPVLLQMVLHRLDDVLFDGGELRPAAAGLDSSEPATRRRIRFRRLASAFHPDRFPELADWLTQRSQAVHRAYARFKQDPEAPIAAPAPAQEPAGRNVRPANPRVRKRRFRAFADQLRARFGNDRYLAHKLIGGLAVLALLPVLNMVLVPSPSTDERSGSAVSLSDSVDEERPVSGFRVPVSGEDPNGAADESGPGSAGAVSARSPSAPEPPPTEPTADNQQLAAGQSANQPTDQQGLMVGAGPAGDGAQPDSLARRASTPVASPEADDASAGAASSRDDRGQEIRIASAPSDNAITDPPARKPETGNPKPSSSSSDPEVSPLLAAARRAMNPNGETGNVAALQTVDEQLAAMGLAGDTERLYRRIGEEDGDEEEKPVSGFRVPVSGERQAATAEIGEVSSAGGGDGSESLAGQAPTGFGGDDGSDDGEADAVAVPGTRNPKPETSTPGLPENRSLAGQAPTGLGGDDGSTGRESATGAGAGRAGDERGPESRIAAAPSDAAEPGLPARKPETGNPKPAQSAPSPQDAPSTADGTIAAASGRPSVGAGSGREKSELVLGPLGQHPAGEVLQRFHAAMQAGNIAGLAGSFAPDARMDSLRGRDEIADHFRSALNPADSRSVNLKVLRLGREDGGWRVEADLDVRVDRSGAREELLVGRSSFLLGGRDDQLLITWMETE